MVACPAHRRNQWRSEPADRFDLQFDVVSGARAWGDLADPDRPFRHIVPFDPLRANSEELRPAGPALDLLVIDETHNVVEKGEGARRRKACAELSRRSRKVVGTTISPDHLEEDELFQIVDAMDPGRLSCAAFREEIRRTARSDRMRSLSSFMTATRRREVGEERGRDVLNIEVELSDEARGMS